MKKSNSNILSSTFFKNILRRILIFVFRPYIYRELIGWGVIYRIFIGGFKRNWLWAGTKPFWTLGKLHNYLLWVDISQWSDRSTFFLGRWYALPVQLALKEILRPGDEVVDIGANQGMMSLISSRLVGDSGKVTAFEPNPEPRAHFYKNIEKNNIRNIVIYSFALGDKESTLELFVPYINSGGATFGKPLYRPENGYKVQCQVKIGDEILMHLRPVLIKIDVEGFEESVLRGLGKTIERCKPIFVVEMIQELSKRCGSSIEKICGFFEERDYRGYKLSVERFPRRGRLKLLAVKSTSAWTDEEDVLWIHKDDDRRRQLIVSEQST